MKIIFNPKVDKYIIDGCMRCKYGATPQCKINNWREEIEMLRQIVLDTGLKEEIKWSVPVYTYNGKNIVIVNVLKNSANIGFFKGALLKDIHKILQQQGNIQSARLIKFTQTAEIENLKEILKSYIKEAISIEKSGQKFEFKKNPEPIPDELKNVFENDLEYKRAFNELTPGRQRSFIIHFSQPKQEKTKYERIEKCRNQIMNGLGFNERKKIKCES
ncbi:MAG: DUF1801 domain-containing protein [Bacteroidetes bacterium]|nr:DUF1801 domain-containing protein [Bacteroidota bacterium]